MNNESTIYVWVGEDERLSEGRRVRRIVERVREGKQGSKGKFLGWRG